MDRVYTLDDLRQVKGIGSKTIERIKEQFDDSEYVSKYDPSNHIEPNDLVQGDMLEKMNGIPDNSVDLLLTDPPYKIVQGGATNDAFTLTGGSDYSGGRLFGSNDIEFSEWAEEVYRVQKEGTHAYVFTNDRNMQGLMSAFTNVGYQLLNILVWNKNTHSPNRYYLKNVEFIVMFRKGRARNINAMGSFASMNYTAVKDKIHPSQKPEELLMHLIKNSTNESELILDPFAGSGSTLIASKKLGRNFIGIELDENYYKIAQNRIEKAKENAE